MTISIKIIPIKIVFHLIKVCKAVHIGILVSIIPYPSSIPTIIVTFFELVSHEFTFMKLQQLRKMLSKIKTTNIITTRNSS